MGSQNAISRVYRDAWYRPVGEETLAARYTSRSKSLYEDHIRDQDSVATWCAKQSSQSNSRSRAWVRDKKRPIILSVRDQLT